MSAQSGMFSLSTVSIFGWGQYNYTTLPASREHSFSVLPDWKIHIGIASQSSCFPLGPPSWGEVLPILSQVDKKDASRKGWQNLQEDDDDSGATYLITVAEESPSPLPTKGWLSNKFFTRPRDIKESLNKPLQEKAFVFFFFLISHGIIATSLAINKCWVTVSGDDDCSVSADIGAGCPSLTDEGCCHIEA